LRLRGDEESIVGEAGYPTVEGWTLDGEGKARPWGNKAKTFLFI